VVSGSDSAAGSAARFEYQTVEEMRAEVQGEIGAYVEIAKRAYTDCLSQNLLFSAKDREDMIAIYHLLWMVHPHQIIAAKYVAKHIAEDELLEIMSMP
jgi:hypothetical protein